MYPSSFNFRPHKQNLIKGKILLHLKIMDKPVWWPKEQQLSIVITYSWNKEHLHGASLAWGITHIQEDLWGALLIWGIPYLCIYVTSFSSILLCHHHCFPSRPWLHLKFYLIFYIFQRIIRFSHWTCSMKGLLFSECVR